MTTFRAQEEQVIIQDSVYCEKCNDSKNFKLCGYCYYDSKVMINYTDAKKLYKLTKQDCNKLKSKKERFKYFIKDIEDLVIDKLKDQIDQKSIKLFAQIQILRQERLDYMNKYIAIRNELNHLVKKTLPDYKFDISKSIISEIKLWTDTSDDVYTCVNNVYNYVILSKNRKELVNNLFKDTFGEKSIYAVDLSDYYNFINIKKLAEDQVLNFFEDKENCQRIKEKIEYIERKNIVENYIKKNFKKKIFNTILLNLHVMNYIQNGGNLEDTMQIVKNKVARDERINKVTIFTKKFHDSFNNFMHFYNPNYNIWILANEEIEKYTNENIRTWKDTQNNIKIMICQYIKRDQLKNYIIKNVNHKYREIILKSRLVKEFLDAEPDITTKNFITEKIKNDIIMELHQYFTI